MNTANIKKYAPLARNTFITAVTKRANELGIYDSHIEEANEEGQTLKIEGRSVDLKLKGARNKLIAQVESTGFTALMEHIAYTWFNRLCAIRFMELHGYLDHGLCVLSHPENKSGYEILEHAQDVAEDLGLNRDQIIELKLAGNQDELLYRTLLLGQCHALHKAMPFLFEAIDDETELLLPDNLTRTDSILRGLVNDIPAEDWEQVEVIGWLYQFYISEKKDQVIGKVVKSEDIPAATQLFTPNWIVKYLVQNSVGRQWLQTYPDSSIKAGMEYYIEPAKQTDEVNAQIKAITPDSIEPETIKVLDPACGSGHILVEAYQVLKAIYEERGYRSRDIPQLILENNLFGLDIDDRAAQLAGFALMMMARADDRRIFTRGVQLNVMAMQPTTGISLQNEDCLVIQDEQQREEFVKTVQDLLTLFEQAKTFGSLIELSEHIADYLPTAECMLKKLADSGDLFAQNLVLSLMPIIKQAQILARKYDAVVANPPYMGGKFLNPKLKKFVNKFFNNSKADLYGVFIERNIQLTKEVGYISMITIPNWMFLSSFDKLRNKILENQHIDTFVHIGRGVWGSDFGSCAFVLQNISLENTHGIFKRLFKKQGAIASNKELLRRFFEYPQFEASPSDFKKIPGSPIAYWVSDQIRYIFENSTQLKEIAKPKLGMRTGDNDRFIRIWSEIDIKKSGFRFHSAKIAQESGLKWFPYNKGGEFRRWYGNNDYLVNWENDGHEIKTETLINYPQLTWDNLGWKISNERDFFKPCLEWSRISSSYLGVRYSEGGFLFDTNGSSAFPEPSDIKLLISFLCTKLSAKFAQMINPSIAFQAGDLAVLPIYNSENIIEDVNEIFDKSVQLSRLDWNTYETSWDYKTNPLTVGWVSGGKAAKNAGLCDKVANPAYELADIYVDWQAQNQQTIQEMQRLEEENNHLFIDAYGLQDELTPDVPLEQITLTVNPKYRYGGNLSDEALENRFQSDTLAELISYAIGCMMGRYSLDQEGLVYAHADNEGFSELVQQGTYKTFSVDDDGIIPLTDQEWFADDATQRFREFVRVIWGEDNLQANLDFVEESLCLYAIKAKSGESSLENIRRYLSSQFYKDHLKTYKKRPIYWLFSSGKQKAFECLVYLHRYNESTLSRMRTEYVTPLLGKYEASAMVLQKQMEDASTTAESNRFKKSLTALEKKQTELSEFDDKLKHYADMRISLDLDDGVKVNYGKFGNLLAEVKAVTGKK